MNRKTKIFSAKDMFSFLMQIENELLNIYIKANVKTSASAELLISTRYFMNLGDVHNLVPIMLFTPSQISRINNLSNC